MRTVYVDVLLVCNLYMNFLLLRLTARLTHTKCRTGRCLTGAGLGAAGSLMILLPPLPFLLSLLCKAGLAAGMCLITFGRRQFWQKLLCFGGVSCGMAGILLALSLSGRVWYANGSWYPDISLRALVLWTIAAYGMLCVVQYFHNRTHPTADGYTVHIRYGAHTAAVEGLADTGNTLVDFCTGKPVILCEREALSALLPETLPPARFRPLPYATAAGTGLVYVFRPDEVLIRKEETAKSVDVLVGIGGQTEHKAIFNPKLLRC